MFIWGHHSNALWRQKFSCWTILRSLCQLQQGSADAFGVHEYSSGSTQKQVTSQWKEHFEARFTGIYQVKYLLIVSSLLINIKIQR